MKTFEDLNFKQSERPGYGLVDLREALIEFKNGHQISVFYFQSVLDLCNHLNPAIYSVHSFEINKGASDLTKDMVNEFMRRMQEMGFKMKKNDRI